MPVFEYICERCGKSKEIITIKSDTSKVICYNCDTEMKRVMSVANFTVKGYSEKNGYSKKE